MSNQGVRGFYQITTTIKDNLLNDENVNTVTTGDITKIDLSKQTIYPLSHILVNNVSQEDQVLRFNISVFCMDIVDVSKDETINTFVGNNNEHDVLNTQLAVINKLIEMEEDYSHNYIEMTYFKYLYNKTDDANKKQVYETRFDNYQTKCIELRQIIDNCIMVNGLHCAKIIYEN